MASSSARAPASVRLVSAPQYVPSKPVRPSVRSYESPPWRYESWRADRPGDVVEEGQPEGAMLGYPGPDQGYALTLLNLFDGKLHLREGEIIADVEAGVVAVALKRASLFARAPVVHDLTVGFCIWGYLDADPAPELVALRRELFRGVAHPHHYAELRRVADSVPEEALRKPHKAVQAQHGKDWRSLIDVPDAR